jgi:hypothetical protein
MVVAIVAPCCRHLQAKGLYHEYGGRMLLRTVGTYPTYHTIWCQVPDDTAVMTIVSQARVYYYWFCTKCLILQC